MSTLPAVGRTMHYYTLDWLLYASHLAGAELHPGADDLPSYRGPLAAIVTDVHDDGEAISACVFQPAGLPTIAEKIQVVQQDEIEAVRSANELKEFVCWPPQSQQ